MHQIIEGNSSKKNFHGIIYRYQWRVRLFMALRYLSELAKRMCSGYLLPLIKILFESRTARIFYGDYTFLRHVLIGCWVPTAMDFISITVDHPGRGNNKF